MPIFFNEFLYSSAYNFSLIWLVYFCWTIYILNGLFLLLLIKAISESYMIFIDTFLINKLMLDILIEIVLGLSSKRILISWYNIIHSIWKIVFLFKIRTGWLSFFARSLLPANFPYIVRRLSTVFLGKFGLVSFLIDEHLIAFTIIILVNFVYLNLFHPSLFETHFLYII